MTSDFKSDSPKPELNEKDVSSDMQDVITSHSSLVAEDEKRLVRKIDTQ
jgi:hypothetical protein